MYIYTLSYLSCGHHIYHLIGMLELLELLLGIGDVSVYDRFSSILGGDTLTTNRPDMLSCLHPLRIWYVVDLIRKKKKGS